MKRGLLLFAAFAMSAVASPAQAAPTIRTVAIKNFAFGPAPTPFVRGDKVKWTNLDSTFDGHTSTGDLPLRLWSSPNMGKNGTFISQPLTAAGTYPYTCTVHRSMKGKIQVPLSLSKARLKITLTLASGPAPTGYKYIPQLRAADGTFKSLTTTGVGTPTYVYNAPKAGTYMFRSALQKNGNPAPAAFFSVPLSIKVP